jgi:hypothetical protein
MAVTKKTRRKTRTSKTTSVGKRQTVEAIFESYGLPGWLGWGTMGAESTYGTNGSYAFGGIALPNSGTGDWIIEARESAKAYAGLVKTYGSVKAAVPHYSGNSYEIDHVESLAKGGAPQAKESVSTAQVQMVGWDPRDMSPLWRLFHGEAPLPKFPGQDALPFGGGAGGKLGDIPGDVVGAPGELLQAATATTAFLSMLTDVKFWIRTGEAIAALILIYMGLHALTGQGPSASNLGSAAAAAAIVK